MNKDEDPNKSIPDHSASGQLENEFLGDEKAIAHQDPSLGLSWLGESKNHKLIVFAAIALLFILFLPRGYRALKNMRATEYAEESAVAFSLGDIQNGISLLSTAQQFSPGSLSVQHSVELYNARAGDMNSLAELLKQMRSGSLTASEVLGIAEVEVNAGREKEASELLLSLQGRMGKKEMMRLVLLQAALLARQGNISLAATRCLSSAGTMGKNESAFLRIQGALYLLALHTSSSSRTALDILRDAAREKTEASLPAWRIATKLTLSSSPDGGAISNEYAVDLLKIFPHLSNALIHDHLTDAELEMKLDPSRDDAVVKNLESQYGHSDRSVMLEVARWMNANGFHAEAISFAGDERPRTDTDWLLIVLDAKTAQGKWREISRMLDFPAGIGIPDAVRYLFLARAAMMLGDQADADDAWKNVTASLHLETPETLAYIAGYEEKIGALDHAAQTYREMVSRKETRRLGLSSLIRIQPSTVPAATLIPLYEELLANAPDFSDAEGDLDYLKLLTGEGGPQVASDAERLLKAQPDSLARISTAALGRLKSGDSQGANALYAGKSIDWPVAPLPWRVVRSAVLRKAGNTGEADRMTATIDLTKLRPEEILLLKEGANSHN